MVHQFDTDFTLDYRGCESHELESLWEHGRTGHDTNDDTVNTYEPCRQSQTT